MPNPLFRKLVATIAIGFLCLFFGSAYFFATKDMIFFLLSAAVCVCCLVKGGFLYQTIKKHNYISLSGTCIELKRHALRNTSIITFVLDDGSTFELSLDRKMKVHKDVRYELFFEVKRISDPQHTSPSSMHFLCLEEIS